MPALSHNGTERVDRLRVFDREQAGVEQPHGRLESGSRLREAPFAQESDAQVEPSGPVLSRVVHRLYRGET